MKNLLKAKFSKSEIESDIVDAKTEKAVLVFCSQD